MEKLEKVNQKRPVLNKPNTKRYEQIRDAIDQYKKAMDAGFYIEAIALMESAMSDRLESTLNYLFPLKDFSFNSVGFLAKQLLDNGQFLNENWVSVLQKIREWAKQRNDAIHQMVKLLPDNDKSFQERYDGLKQCAKDGYELFKKLNNEKKKTTRYQDKHPLIYKLKDPQNNVNGYPDVLRIKCKVADLQKLQDGKSFDESSVFEAENGTLWRKQLLDLYYDLEKS